MPGAAIFLGAVIAGPIGLWVLVDMGKALIAHLERRKRARIEWESLP